MGDSNVIWSGPRSVVLPSGVKIAYDTFGDPSLKATGKVVLLIMGHGMQLLAWREDGIVRRLAARGYYVIRFDNRDVGLSSRVTRGGSCKLRPVTIYLRKLFNRVATPLACAWLCARALLTLLRTKQRAAGASAGAYKIAAQLVCAASAWRAHRRGASWTRPFPAPTPAPSYGLDEMAGDAVGLLDALGVARAHVAGASMGGMIAQEMAAAHPDRLASMVLMITSPGPGSGKVQPPLSELFAIQRYGDAAARALAAAVAGAGVQSAEELPPSARLAAVLPSKIAIGRHFKTRRFFDSDVAAEHLREYVTRCPDDTGKPRQAVAILCRANNAPALRAMRGLPCLVVHGENDRMIPYANALELARLVPGARLATMPGGGHDLPKQWCAEITDLMDALFRGDLPEGHRVVLSEEGTEVAAQTDDVLGHY